MLPDLGEGLTEAEVVQWHVAPGDEVNVDQIVVTVETAKASVDLPCPYAGYVTALHSEPGAVLEVGKPLLTVGEQQSAGSGNVLVGYGTSPAKRSGRRRVTPQGRPSPARNGGPVAAARAGAPKVISPVVRRLAKDNGISLAGLAPTGPGGVIRRSDVVAALRIGDGNVASHTVAQEPSALRAGRCGDIRVPLRGMRKTISDNLTRSRREIPEATTWVDVDATALMAARDQITAVSAAAHIGLLALFARISVAASSPRGLVAPVVHGAGQMTTARLAAALRELTELARDGKLSPAQMTGGTFTLNNYGVFGTDGATPIINYPEAAMLGVGRIIDRPWAHEGQVKVRKVAQLGLTFDHRVCDGATAGGFLRFVADCVERPALLLAES